MTIVITLKSNKPFCAQGNAKSRRKAARAAKVAQDKNDIDLVNKSIVKAICTTRTVLKAVSMPTTKSTQDNAGSCCLPHVALFRV